MSKHSKDTIGFYDYNGEWVEIPTPDKKTKEAIQEYKSVYNQINSYQIASVFITPKREGFIRQAIQAQTQSKRILCAKEYLPGVPKEFDCAKYQCAICNLNNNQAELITETPIKRYYGGVPMLYFNLFNKHIK